MKRGFFVITILLLVVRLGFAQTTKTGVLVIGNGSNAVGASIQSAVSGVKTVLLLPDPGFVLSASGNLRSGIEAELQKRMLTTNTSAAAMVKIWTDTLKNLTVVRGTPWIRIKRSGGGWHIALLGGKSIKAGVLVNADASGKVNTELKLTKAPVQWSPFGYTDFLYRTSIATGYTVSNSSANFLQLSKLLVPAEDNLVVLNSDHESIAAGQAAGATAAYAAFFKKKTSEANLKVIQGELINYKLSLVPFADVNPIDSNWKAIQLIGLSGFIKAELINGTAFFRPDFPVSREEIMEPIKSYYYKAQIWFDDNKAPQMTLATTLKMITYVGGLSPENTIAEVKKNWKTTYRFNSNFEQEKVISRREFAVLVSQYLKPFNVTIDKSGKVLR